MEWRLGVEERKVHEWKKNEEEEDRRRKIRRKERKLNKQLLSNHQMRFAFVRQPPAERNCRQMTRIAQLLGKKRSLMAPDS